MSASGALLADATMVFAGVLVISGAAKLGSAGATSRALEAVGLPHQPLAVRGLAAVEIEVGTWSIVAPSELSQMSLAAIYISFAGYIAAVMMGGYEIPSCGCFGVADTKPGVVHLVWNTIAAVVCLTAALAVRSSLASSFRSDALAGLTLAAMLAEAMLLATALLTTWPDTLEIHAPSNRRP
jgi:hypothetical protein